MAYIICNIETGAIAHVEIARYMSIEDAKQIPYQFASKQDAFDCLDKVSYPENRDYEIVEL